ncbi:MAG TPA: tetratricopeptide repeat protein, partial [Polyangia bacterium]
MAGRCDEAAKAYRASLALQPKNPVVQVRLAHCLAKTGGAGEAKQMLLALADEPGTTGLLALQELGDLAL